MKKVVLALLVLCAIVTLRAASAVQTVAYHNVHLRVADPAKATEWYIKYLGASTTPPPYSVAFGKTVIAFVRSNTQNPSAGSVVDHIGISYADLNAKMKDFEAGGAKILQPVQMAQGLFPYGYIEDPWGVKIEVVQDPEQLGFHHVHLRVKDPQATLKWFEEMLGGQRSKLGGRLEGLRYGGVWLLAAAAGSDNPVPSADRAIQNLAFQVANVDESMTALKSRDVKAVVEPRSLGELRYAFVEDPNGVRIELIKP